MLMRLHKILMLTALWVATGTSAEAQEPETNLCLQVWPEPFPAGQPFLLNDTRSGLTLHLERDGRHMTATDHDGNIIWDRNLFDDPRLWQQFPPPPRFSGTPPVSPEEEKRRSEAYIAGLSIDRIGIEPDCMLSAIDNSRVPGLRGHYIRAGSGTRIFWLLDAKTGDLQIDEIN